MDRLPLFSAFIAIALSTALFSPVVFAADSANNLPQKKFKSANIHKKTRVASLQKQYIKMDGKITPEEKNDYKAVLDQANQFADDQAHALNKVPGVQVSGDDLKEEKKDGVSLNPIKWIFGPVIKLQAQSVKLEQDIMKLTGPIAALQPGMLSLENRMTSMQGQLGHLEDRTSSVQGELTNIRQDIASMHSTLTEIKRPVTELKGPIESLHDPILAIEKPITGVDKDLNDVKVLLSLVITSIYAAALIIAVGTPVASILVWRNRQKFLPTPTAKQQHEEDNIKQATKTMDHQLRS